MNITDIRRAATCQEPDWANVAAMCQKALEDRTDSVGDHAEILYHLVRARHAQDPTQLAVYADRADRASVLAIEASSFLLAVKAACFRISLLDVARVAPKTSLTQALAEVLNLLITEWRFKMSPEDYKKAHDEINWLVQVLVPRERKAS